MGALDLESVHCSERSDCVSGHRERHVGLEGRPSTAKSLGTNLGACGSIAVPDRVDCLLDHQKKEGKRIVLSVLI